METGADVQTPTLVTLFEAQVRNTPDRIALCCEDQELSYLELNKSVNRLARRLRECGVGLESRVGLCAERSPELIIALIAILKAGAAYVSLDPEYPRSLLEFTVKDAKAAVVVVQRHLRGVLPDLPVTLVETDEGASLDANPPLLAGSDDLAYVIYTSGSSGHPKGVMITNRNVVRLLNSTREFFVFRSDDIWTLFHSYAFDFSVWEIWGALGFGARLVIVPYVVSRSPENFLQLLLNEQITVLNQTPSAFQQLQAFAANVLSLRYVIFGGEALTSGHMQPWCRCLQRNGTKVVNMYGITETTVHVTCYDIPETASESETNIAIGRPIDDLQVDILDEWLQPIPSGITGELYVGGAGLARGYLNRPGLTAERFLPDPFAEIPGQRVYRTGDRGRWRTDRNLEVHGRLDEQIKLRGYRVEPGEIELVLREQPGVRQAVVMVREDEPGSQTLVAYVVPDGTPPFAHELKASLRERLPVHMVPSVIVFLEQLPLTINGKLDRHALPAVQEPVTNAHEGNGPRTAIEEIVAGIWEQVLRLGKVSLHENFFDAGGHSLLATQVISRARKAFNVDVPLSTFFEFPTIAGLARSVERARHIARPVADCIPKADLLNDFPLSFAQERLWFLDQLQPGSASYNIPFAIKLQGRLVIAGLKAALNDLSARHAMFRTSFPEIAGVARQRVEEGVHVFIRMIDLEEADEGLARQVLKQEARIPFDLRRAPLWRTVLLRLGAEDHILLVTMHHIITDAWSAGILISEFSELYRAWTEKRRAALVPLEIEYADFAVWQRKWLRAEVLQSQLSYWKHQLHALPVLELPCDRVRPAVPSYRGSVFRFRIPRDTAAALKQLSRRENVTLFMTLLALFDVLLAHYSGQWDIVIGADIANRNLAELENVVGFFVNTLVFRVQISPVESFVSLVAKTREIALRGFEHQDTPFEKLVEDISPERNLSYAPLFQVKIALQNTPQPDRPALELAMQPWQVDTETAKFDLTLGITEDDDGLDLSLEYATDLFEAPTIERMANHFRTLIGEVISDPARCVSQLSMLTETEKEQIMSWNNTTTEVPVHTTMELLNDHTVQTPDRVAAVFGACHLSYEELNRRSNHLAQRLQNHGVRSESSVGICVRRSLDFIIGISAILKAGGAFVPLDPSYPLGRLTFIIQDADVHVVLTQTSLKSQFPSHWPEFICVDDDANGVGGTHPLPTTGAYNLAYIIYTSGSTGQPKGVMIEHRGLGNVSAAQSAIFDLGASPHVLQFASPSFDACVFELLLALTHGGTIHLICEDTSLSPEAVADTIAKQGITHAVLPPTLLAELPKETLASSLSMVIAAGEALTPKVIAGLQNRAVVNAYGPTESTIWATAHRCNAGLRARPPIGAPIDNCRAYILDEQGCLASVGITGELYIAGIGLARGYINRPGLTAERFLPDAFATEAGGRMYRTGDLAKWQADGTLYFIGRNDFQVKVRGFRVELGEVESVLERQAGIRRAVVTLSEMQMGNPRLIAYIVSDGKAISSDELKNAIREHLPEYMMPSCFVFLDKIPLTPNAKVDRKALAALETREPQVRSGDGPRNDVEASVAVVWGEVLKVEHLTRDDNFFDLGGQSLLAVRTVARIREMLRVEVAVRDLFDHPVLADFARQLSTSAMKGLPPIMHVDRSERLPLSFAQQRLWFMAQIPGGSKAYQISIGLRLLGELDRTALRCALNRVVARHEVLRTNFIYSNGEQYLRIIREQDSAFALKEIDLSLEADPELAFSRLAESETTASFDLATDPLIRGCLISLAEHEHALLIMMHHIISDGWSRDILCREVSSLYQAYRRGESDPLPKLPLQYADYACWQREWIDSDLLRPQAEYWIRNLSGAPLLLDLPADHERAAQQDYKGAFAPLQLDTQLTARLRELSKQLGATLYVVMLACWATLLWRLSGKEDLIVGTPVANRQRPETQGLIGLFVNLVAIRTDFSGSPSISQLVEQVKVRVLEAQQYQDIPFERVVDMLHVERDLAYNPIFQIAFTWQNTDEIDVDLPLLQVTWLNDCLHRTAKFDLALSLEERVDQIVGGIEYATSLFDADTIERYLSNFLQLLKEAARDATRPLNRVALLTDKERQQVLEDWNQTAQTYPQDSCLHQLFEQQAQQRPQQDAVIYEKQSLTYAELNHRANQLAHYLRNLGITAEDRVGLCLERSVELVIALVAVLKAGAAYVPLDPNYPADRLKYMLEDARVPVLVTENSLRRRLPSFTGYVVYLDGDWSEIAKQSRANLASRVDAENTAYVMYTSGSSGKPKGVVVAHRSVINVLQDFDRRVPVAEGSKCSVWTSFSFDVSVFEYLSPLLSGCTLVIPNDACRLDAGAYLEWLKQERVQSAFIPPSAIPVLAERVGQDNGPLKRIVIGMQPTPGRLVEAIARACPQAGILNGYGPTETTINSTLYRVRDGAELRKGPVPAGEPVGNTQIYVLDAHWNPLPIGVLGDVYIAGVGLARGYFNRPALTAERFLANPFSQQPGLRLYRSGDIGRWLPNGNLELRGRADEQVKIRGYRVELGEIEDALQQVPGIDEAVVVVRGSQSDFSQQLIAYYTSKEDLGAEELALSVSAKLPAYMVPNAYVHLQSLPRTPNGKLDRKLLPHPDASAYAAKRYEAPVAAVETALAEIWGEVLKRKQVSRHDNFFDLGGHSLLAIRAVDLMRRRGLDIDVRSMFTAHSLAELAAAAGAALPKVEIPPNRIPPNSDLITPDMLTLVHLSTDEIARIVKTVPGGAANIQDIYPLAPLQQGVLFHHLMGEESDPYILATEFSFDSRERLDAYLAALQHVIDRHDILRTAIVWEGVAQPLQVVCRRALLKAEELTMEVPADTDLAACFYEQFNPQRSRMDVRQAPLIAAHITYDEKEQRWLMMQSLHHLVGDHSTLAAMQAEIEALLLDEAISLPAPVPFRNLVAEARLGTNEEEHTAFFRQMLGDVEEPTAPFGLLNIQADGDTVESARYAVEIATGQRLLRAARKHGVSRASICHLAWALVLARLTSRNDVVFGTVVLGRLYIGGDTDRAVGPFINTLPLRVHLENRRADVCVREVHSQLLNLIPHEHASLTIAQRCSAVPPGTPLFTALLNYRHNESQTALPDGARAWRGVRILRGEERTNYPISMTVDDNGDSFALIAQTSAPVTPERVCKLMHTALASLVGTLCAYPSRPVRDVEILPQAEREKMLQSFNDTAKEYPGNICVQQLFESQVKQCPDAVALICEDNAVTYRELNRRANHVAHQLINVGIKPDDRVALCVRRGIEIVVGLLAVLKAGGGYVPIDPMQPRDRIEFFLRDSTPSALVTEGLFRDELPAIAPPVVILDNPEAFSIAYTEDDPDPAVLGVGSRHLAYLMYTSGSSGTPKGTEVSHDSLTNFLRSMQVDPGFEAMDRLLAVTTISFDIAALELLLPLVTGAMVVIVNSEGIADGFYLQKLITEHEISVMQGTPATWRLLLGCGWAASGGMRMLCGGEALPTDLAADLLSSRASIREFREEKHHQKLDFSLFFFAAADDGSRAKAFKLLQDASRFADEHNFKAVWTPERHFHPFGGIYPNPAVIGASIASTTTRIQIRAGSVVLPLHDPVRVAEEWSAVDNISGGRTGVSFASGWNVNDFVLAPDQFADRKQNMLREIETVRQLWRGGTVQRRNGAGEEVSIRIYPKPVQKELPIWLTAGGSFDTFRAAGQLGAGVLTHLLGQDIASLKEKVKAYRTAFREAGHPGTGRVTLMLHAFVAETLEQAEMCVRGPFCKYLEESLDLIKVMAQSSGTTPEKMSSTDRAALLNHAFERYFSESALFGDENTCFATLQHVAAADVDEIACLIDFGVEFEPLYASLERLAALKERWEDFTALTTKMTCTPLSTGQELMLFNMYGPTETTVWSAISRVRPGTSPIGAGKPIANTQMYVLDSRLQPVPLGVEGELYIGGAGVARGYHKCPVLTAAAFVPDPFSQKPGARLYRTGDLARWTEDGFVEYRGRNDFQVKVRGFRIEPGEIEAALRQCIGVREAAVIARQDTPSDARLVAYVVPQGDTDPQPAALRSALTGKLPEYMIPSAFVALAALPMTRNGKLDRRRLPRPDEKAIAVRAYEAPQSDSEAAVAEIWRDLLGIERVGRGDDFFELGGHSLLAIQMVSRLRQAVGWDVPLRMLFEAPTVAGLACKLDTESASLSEILSNIENLSDEEAHVRLRGRAS
jgi:natural product biosynthesis luciferase-like monooxygenase protein/amino acid adenylation domain-containing protein